MASFSDDFAYTGDLDDNGYTYAGFDPALSANGSVAATTGISSFALVELDTNEQSVEVIVDVPTGSGTMVVSCAPTGGGYSFPNIGGYALEIVDPFSSDTWFWRLYRSGSEVIGYQGIGGSMPFTLELAHDGAGNVDVIIDGSTIDTYDDTASPLTGTWAGFGGPSGTTFDDFAAADAGGPPPMSEGSVSGSIAWVGTVNGEAPTVGASEGTADGSIAWVGAVTGARTSLGSVAGSIGWASTATGSGPAIPGVWEQVAPPGVELDPDVPSAGSNFGFQSIALASDGTVYVTKDHEGLFRSTDHGDTWTHVSTDGHLESGTPWTLQVDPFDDDVLWSNAGFGDGGPYVSTNGGATWTKKAVGAPTQNDDVYSIALDPDNEGHLLVAWHSVWSGEAWSGISESFDGGDTWTNHDAPSEDWGTGHAVFFLSDDETWLVCTQADGVWRTANSGTSWTQVHTTPITHGATDCLTKVGSSLFLVTEDVISESTDDGVTWTDISTGITGSDDLSTVATDGVNLYTAPSFPIAGNHAAAEGPWWTRPVAGGTWTELTTSPDTTYGDNSNGPRQSVYGDGYTYTSNYLAGVWRLLTLIQGSISGSITWAGTVNGTTLRSGAATGSIGWAGTVNGTATRRGAANGAIGWAGSVAGTADREGAASGAIGWSGTVTGEAPTVGDAVGSVSGSVAWAGSVAGARQPVASVVGGITWLGSTFGTTSRTGATTGAIVWAGVVAGHTGTPQSAINWDRPAQSANYRSSVVHGAPSESAIVGR